MRKIESGNVVMLWLCFSGENLQENGHLGGEGVQMMLVEQKNRLQETSMDKHFAYSEFSFIRRLTSL